MGFYYLQSRYYDPNICRFINADGLASTGQGFIGTNMFAYCNNRIVSYKDSSGKDAIWIQEGNSAAGEGHSGLMAQDDEGNWWYFYWGPKDETFRFELFTGVPAAGFCVRIDVEGELTSVEDVQKAINSTEFENDRYNRASKITGIVYFSGDYSKTAEVAKDLAKGDTYYLATYNCVQLTLAAFFSSDDRFGLLSYGDLRDCIPNAVYNRVVMLPRDKDERPLPFLW